MKALVMAALLGTMPPTASARPGSGFDSVSLTSMAAGATWTFSTTSRVPAEMDVPYAATSIRLGAGQATSSVGWPGELGASLGSTLIVANGAPDAVRVLNYPVYARAQSGKGPATVNNTTLPTGTMTAHATVTETSAEATLDGASALATTTGTSRSTSSARLTGPTSAVVEGASSVRDVTIAGVVHVGSVVSSARAATDGTTGSVTGTTAVTGVTVAGQAITLDEHGITVVGNGVPVGPALVAVADALAQAQVTLTMSRPFRSVSGGTVEYATGALIVSTPMGVLSLGGVQLRASATRSEPVEAPPNSGPATSPDVGPPGDAFTPAEPDHLPNLPQPSTVGALPPLVRHVAAALLPLSLVTGYGPGWVLLSLLTSLAGAFVLIRLAGWWAPLGDNCPLEQP